MGKEKAKPPIDPEAAKIIKMMVDDERDDVVMIFIPSHDKDKKELNDQEFWADAALKLFGHLYEGATGFTALKGIWVDKKTGEEHHDKPYCLGSA